MKHGSGWITGFNVSPEKIKSDYDRLRKIADKFGRNVDEIEAAAPFVSHVAKDREQARRSIERYIEQDQFTGTLGRHFAEETRLYAIWGAPKECVKRIEQYVALTGVKHLILDLRPANTALESLRLLCDEVIPHFQRK